MSNLINTHINNNLNVSSGVMIDNKIINNDIIYPILSTGGNYQNRTIIVNLVKFNNNLTTNGRPKIHWWISTARWSYPTALAYFGDGPATITLNNGTNLDPTTSPNTAVLRTSLADSNHIYKITIGSFPSSPETLYFMCSVQGIVYSIDFAYNTIA